MELSKKSLEEAKKFLIKYQEAYSKGIDNAVKYATEALYNKVLEYLNNHNIDYVTEFDCNLKPINPNSGKVLPYDIELVNENTIIEVHGSQHYEYENCGWYKRKAKRYNVTTEEYFKQRKSIDDYKEKYAIENGYKFIIIPYWYEKNDCYIEILDNELNNNKT